VSPLSEDEIQAFVNDLIGELPLKDLVSFANMDESGLEVTRQVMERYVQRELGDQEEFQKVMEALWKRLQQTHRLRGV
jgi:hypothetical protein